jgi:hypothetical protein
MSTEAMTYFMKSVQMGSSGVYVGALSQVYRYSASNSRRPSNASAVAAVRAAIAADDWTAAAILLLNKRAFTNFPVSHPMATLLRDFPETIRTDHTGVRIVARYLKTSCRTADRLFQMIDRPKDASKQTDGFRKWMSKGMKIVRVQGSEWSLRSIKVLDAFDESALGPWVIAGNDGDLGFYAKELGDVSRKGRDLLARRRSGDFVVGEAKIQCGSGGGQDKSAEELIHFLEVQVPGLTKVAVIDGSIWMSLAVGRSTAITDRFKELVNEGCYVMSALLVPDFLRQ